MAHRFKEMKALKNVEGVAIGVWPNNIAINSDDVEATPFANSKSDGQGSEVEILVGKNWNP